ncbi:hypothetical protein C437_19082 [Haloarcula vallismortis ATCC 29715]|uniref:Uncharacterized protein n=1 Tax=Haloarcula vallismortis ATCC 29715 TaxID=662477 RepID=M0IVQ8_HALVA|nr:hypothetical protein C437_19082 [Haloarcula vallismortis ATCC 29715]
MNAALTDASRFRRSLGIQIRPVRIIAVDARSETLAVGAGFSETWSRSRAAFSMMARTVSMSSS